MQCKLSKVIKNDSPGHNTINLINVSICYELIKNLLHYVALLFIFYYYVNNLMYILKIFITY